MSTLNWIVASSVMMAIIALVGSVTLVFSRATLERMLLPLVAFAAGSLLGTAFLHLIPPAVAHSNGSITTYVWILIGFLTFFGLEQLLHWHHCQRQVGDAPRPLTYLVLVGDSLHNFLGGLAVAGSFLVDVRLGMTAWLAAAAHEVPQELGDFGILVHGGLSRARALSLNFASGLTFLLGGLLAYALSRQIDTAFLVPFAAGNFIYIAAADLVPEINRHSSALRNLLHFCAFAAGIGLLLVMRQFVDHD